MNKATIKAFVAVYRGKADDGANTEEQCDLLAKLLEEYRDLFVSVSPTPVSTVSKSKPKAKSCHVDSDDEKPKRAPNWQSIWTGAAHGGKKHFKDEYEQIKEEGNPSSFFANFIAPCRTLCECVMWL